MVFGWAAASLASPLAFAQHYNSLHYILSNARIVTSSGEASSANYSLDQARIGDIFGGKAGSTNYTLNAGNIDEITLPNSPSLNPVITPTNNPLQALSGRKGAYASVYINGQEAVPLDREITWSYNITLSEGENRLTITARNRYGLESEPVYSAITIDTTPPALVTVTDDGQTTQDKTSLHAAWTPSRDNLSGIKEYRYAVGTSPGTTDIIGWTSAGLNTEITRTGLTLQHGASYYISVCILDNAGNITESASSDGIAYGSPPEVKDIIFTSPQNFHQGWPVTIYVDAADLDGDTIEYRYLINGYELQAWTTQNHISWSPSSDNIGLNEIKVEARAPNEAGAPKEKQCYIFRRPITPAQ